MYDSAQKRTFNYGASARHYKENGRFTMKTAKNEQGSLITRKGLSY